MNNRSQNMATDATCKNIALSDDGAKISLYLDAGLPCFQGHFPGRPVLPGVVQTGWAVRYATRYLGLPCHIRRLEVVKFRRLLLPDMEIDLTLERKPNGKLVYQYLHEGEVMSSGRIVYPENA